MSVYVDSLMATLRKKGWPYQKSCHLTADSLDELHEFAESIGLKREWFQDHPTFPHYDLTENKRYLAVLSGAVQESRVEAVKRMRATL